MAGARTLPATSIMRSRRLPLAVALVSSAVQFAYLRQGGFFLDDIGNISVNKVPLSIHRLASPVGTGHFQPATQFVMWLAAEPFHTNYAIAALFLAVSAGLGSYWMIQLLDGLFGKKPTHLMIGFLIGTSWVLLNASQWFSSSPATESAVFGIGALLAFSLWMTTSRPVFYLEALVSATIALLFWEIALAIPALLALLWVCFTDDYRSWRRILLGVTPFASISIADLIYVRLQPWRAALSVPTIRQWVNLLTSMVGHGFLPTVIGTGTYGSALSQRDWISIFIVAAALAVVEGRLVVLGRFRFRSLAFFIVGAILVSIPVATARDSATAGTTSRYITFLPILLAISVAGSARERPHESHESHESQARRYAPKVGWLAAATLAVLYLVNLNSTFDTVSWAKQWGATAAAISAHLGSGIRALKPGQQSSLVDSTVPFPIWWPPVYGVFIPGGRLSNLLPFWSSTVHTFGEGPRITGIDASGTLRWATFHVAGVGDLYERITISASTRTVVHIKIEAMKPTQPESPWTIPTGPGTHTFVLTTWSTTVQSVHVTGHDIRVLQSQAGTVTLGSAL